MKNKQVLLWLLLLAVAGNAFGQENARKTVEEIVRAADDEERQAALKRDVKSLERLWSPQLTVNAPTNRVVAGRSEVLKTFIESGIIDFEIFERKIEWLRVDGEMAVVMGEETVRARAGTPLAGPTIKRRFTNIWKKEGGAWRLFWRHANNLPAST